MNIFINFLGLYLAIAVTSFILFHLLGIVETNWMYLKKHKVKGFKFIIRTLIKFPVSIVVNAFTKMDDWVW